MRVLSKLSFVLCALGLSLLVVPLPATHGQATTTPTTKPEGRQGVDSPMSIKSVARAFAVAMTTGDVSQVKRLLAPNYVGIDLHGNVLDRGGRIKQLETTKLKLASIEVSEPVVQMSEQSAILTGIYTVEGELDGKQADGKYRYLDVWAKQDGEWKVIASSLTKLEE